MSRSGRRSLRLAALLLAWLPLVALPACQQKSSCSAPCSRVAACKKAAKDGSPMLGEGKMPPDPECLKKCETKPDDFATCEAIKHSCEELRDCRGAF